MTESHLDKTDLEEADRLLTDLLEGRDRLLTAGEVAELLNINVNTLYLWRASGEVDLPFQRFISPGQTRGVIRYKYSDVVLFLAKAARRGADEAEEEAVDGTADEHGVPAKLPAPLARKKNQRRKAKLEEKLKDKPLAELLENTPVGTNLTVEQFREQRRTELAPPADAVVVENPGEVVFLAPDITPDPEPAVSEPEIHVPTADEIAAQEYLARFAQAFDTKEDQT